MVGKVAEALNSSGRDRCRFWLLWWFVSHVWWLQRRVLVPTLRRGRHGTDRHWIPPGTSWLGPFCVLRWCITASHPSETHSLHSPCKLHRIQVQNALAPINPFCGAEEGYERGLGDVAEKVSNGQVREKHKGRLRQGDRKELTSLGHEGLC